MSRERGIGDRGAFYLGNGGWNCTLSSAKLSVSIFIIIKCSIFIWIPDNPFLEYFKVVCMVNQVTLLLYINVICSNIEVYTEIVI